MKHMNILPVTDGAAIDWSKIPAVRIDCPALTEAVDITASAQICYDPWALFLRLSAWEREIRAVEEGILGMPCRDSCLEFFFCPRKNDNRYFNFEFNPKGCLFLGFGTSILDQMRLIPSEGAEALFHPVITIQADSWEITYRIPFGFIRRFFPDFAPKPGDTIRGNFYKCAECVSHPHYLAWNPVTGTEGAVFHAPGDFGMLHFI